MQISVSIKSCTCTAQYTFAFQRWQNWDSGVLEDEDAKLLQNLGQPTIQSMDEDTPMLQQEPQLSYMDLLGDPTFL